LHNKYVINKYTRKENRNPVTKMNGYHHSKLKQCWHLKMPRERERFRRGKKKWKSTV